MKPQCYYCYQNQDWRLGFCVGVCSGVQPLQKAFGSSSKVEYVFAICIGYQGWHNITINLTKQLFSFLKFQRL